MSKIRILLVDDDSQAQASTRKILELEGYQVTVAGDGEEGLKLLRESTYDLVVSDVRMPKMGGIEFLRSLSVLGETVPTVLMTAFGEVEEAVWAMKLGAVDFLTKPFKRQALLDAVTVALKRARVTPQAAQGGAPERGDWVGRAPAFLALQALVDQVAPTLATVLIMGESGTGKERVARRIHAKSQRAKGPWIAVNCAAIPGTLIEAELFGFARGAFTGAHQPRQGLFESASGGTLFLDEIGDLPLEVQAKLLRVLQEGEIRRIGESQSRRVDVRLVVATHKSLKSEVEAGRFREDLLYRLDVVSMTVPALRDRVEDIPELAYHFMRLAAKRHGKTLVGIEEAALELLLGHPWPGNVRELGNAIERAAVLTEGEWIRARDLPGHLRAVAAASPAITIQLGTPLREVEELLIRKTLEATEGDKNLAAQLLGINSRTIYRKLEQND